MESSSLISGVNNARESLSTLRQMLSVALESSTEEPAARPPAVAGDTEQANPPSRPNSEALVGNLLQRLEALKTDVDAVQKVAENQKALVAARDMEEKMKPAWQELEYRKEALQKEIREKNVIVKLLIDRLRELRHDLFSLSTAENAR